MIKKIAITGPESTGKSKLAEYLAKHYSTSFVPEYARAYISELKRPYTYDDILTLSKKQLESENNLIAGANEYLFCDTELIVSKIWCEFKYGKCHEWILENLEKNHYDLYLLTNIDLPWQPDPLREHPDKRKIIFGLYLSELKKRKYPYVIISGTGEKRYKNGIDAINNLFG